MCYEYIYICLQSCTTMVSHLLPFMADITNSWSQWLLHYMDDYYICPGSIFWCEFNCDVYLVIGLTCFGNLRISKYVYAFCTIFQCKFNYNVYLVIGLTCFGDFGNLLYVYAFCIIFQCKFNCGVCLMIEPPCFGYFETLYTFCTVLQCKFNCNVCLVIIPICFGNFQNQYITIYILYQFLMWIQLLCLFGDWTNLF